MSKLFGSDRRYGAAHPRDSVLNDGRSAYAQRRCLYYNIACMQLPSNDAHYNFSLIIIYARACIPKQSKCSRDKGAVLATYFRGQLTLLDMFVRAHSSGY